MTFKKINYKLFLLLFLISIFIMPFNAYAYTNKVILGGENVGIEVHSKGILVVGFYNVSTSSPGKDAGLQLGDLIVKIDDTAISTIADLTNYINDSSNKLTLTYQRGSKTYTTDLTLAYDDGIYKTGIYVKDSIIGIGTLTFINPVTSMYGALGHEIDESTTGMKFEIKDGKIFKSDVIDIKKSNRNDPGEKRANYYSNIEYGTILKNTEVGIFGKYIGDINNDKLIDVANTGEITTGEAYIYTVVSNSLIEKFKINILSINNNSIKNILFEVVDENLLNKTNGIVQGMSGSPIVQNGKLVGAVTHVVLDNPAKGYGILIENMLKETD